VKPFDINCLPVHRGLLPHGAAPENKHGRDTVREMEQGVGNMVVHDSPSHASGGNAGHCAELRSFSRRLQPGFDLWRPDSLHKRPNRENHKCHKNVKTRPLSIGGMRRMAGGAHWQEKARQKAGANGRWKIENRELRMEKQSNGTGDRASSFEHQETLANIERS